MRNGNGEAMDMSALIEDRLDEGRFRVDRRIYLDQDIFDREMARVFERSWVYLCHESQVPDYGDYYSTHIGRQPVFVIRGRDGGLKGFVNACSHRAAVLTPRRRGRAKTLVCRFHGWCFDTEGACVLMKDAAAE